VIVEALMAPLRALFDGLAWLLPDYELTFPGMGPMAEAVANVNSVVPIAPVVQVAVTLLGFFAVFAVFRLVLLIRHVVLP
jgi:hypothetical protein